MTKLNDMVDAKLGQWQREALSAMCRAYNESGITPEVCMGTLGHALVILDHPNYGTHHQVRADDYLAACRAYHEGRCWAQPFADLTEEIAQVREAQATLAGVA